MKTLLLVLLALPQDFPEPSGYVVDRVGVMDAGHVRAITAFVEDLKRKTGAELAVAIVPTVKPLSIDQYSIQLAERWKPGKAGENNGVLVVVALQDRKYRVEVGYGLEDVLPDGLVGQMGRDYFVPLFQQGKYSEGVLNMSAAIIAVVAKKYNVRIEGAPAPRAVSRRRGGCGPGAYLIIFVIILSMVLGGGRRMGFFPFFLLLGMGSGWHGRGYRRSSFGGGGGFGGGFGGFGGGSFGGGGASGSW